MISFDARIQPANQKLCAVNLGFPYRRSKSARASQKEIILEIQEQGVRYHPNSETVSIASITLRASQNMGLDHCYWRQFYVAHRHSGK